MRHVYNIVGFNAGEPDFNTFDITTCFSDDQFVHKMIRTGYDSNFVILGAMKKARDQARLALTAAAQVSPIRVQNVELYVEAEEPALYILFTLVDFPTGIQGVDPGTLPNEVTIPLQAAVANLQKVLESGTLKIELPKVDGVSKICNDKCC